MTAAIGNDAVFVPILPSLDKFFTETQKGSKQAGERAGKSFSDALTKSVEQAEKRVSSTSRAYERAQNRAADAADKTRLAETKLVEVMENSDATAAQVQKATNDLNKARRDQTAAEGNAEKASGDLTKAQEGLTKAQQEQEDAVQSGTKGMKDWALSAEDAEKASSDLENAQKALEVGIAATGAALVAGIAGLVGIGSGFHDMSRQIAVATGATGDDLRDLEESAMSVATKVPVSFEESADALATLNTMTGESGPALEALTSQVLEASNLLGEDGTANAEKFGNALAQWEVDAATGADTLDGLFTITQDYGVGLDALTGHLTTYGSVLKNVGFSMEESAVLFGSLEKSGISVSRIMPGMNKAFRDWADEGLNVREELGSVVERVAEAEDGTEALNIATDAFGAQGASRLTTAIRNGSFALEDFESVLGDTDGAIADTAAETRTLEESFQLMKNEALVAIEPLARELFDNLVPAVQLAGEKLVEVIDWIQENEDLVRSLAVGVGVAAGAFGAFRLATIGVDLALRAKNVAALLAAGGFRTLDKAMRRNVIGMIVTAVAGLVAGLVYFFTQTERGQEIWETFTTALGEAWDWVVDKLSAGWEWIRTSVFDPLMDFVTNTLQPIWESVVGFLSDSWDRLVTVIQWSWENIFEPVFSAIWQIAQVTLGVIGTVILAPLLMGWNLLSDGIKWAWENIIKPAWDDLTSVATWMWENVLQPVFGWITDGWDLLVSGIVWYWENQLKPAWENLQTAALWMWENVLSPVFDFIGNAWNLLVDGIKWYWENVLKVAWENLQNAATWMYENVLRPVFSWIGDRWDDLSNAIRWAYDNIIQPAWDALGDALTWLYENIVQPTLQWFQDRWDDMANALEAGWRWIDDNVFQALSDGLDWLQGVFDSAVDGIARIWDGIKAAAATPVKFVIDTVWNNGILQAWNRIADFLPGIDTVDPYEPAWLGNYARGTASIVPGARSVNRDNMNFVSTDGRYGIGLAGGEGIAHQHLVAGLGGKSAWDRLNYVSRTRGPDAVKDELLPVEKHGPESAFSHRHLGSFNAGGVIPAMMDIVLQKYPGLTMTSGYRAGASGYHGRGLATDWSNGSTSTPMQLALAQDIATTYPGSAQLIYDHPGWTGNIANGRNVGAFGGYYNLAEAGRHDHHVHWAMTEAPTMPFGGGVFEGGNDGGGGGIFNWLAERARGIWDSIVSPIKGLIDRATPDWGDSMFANVPMGFFNAAKDAAWDRISSLFGSAGGSVDVSDISGPIVDQVEEVFARHGFTGQQWEDAKWIIQQESSWNPTAVNPSSGAFGLFQFNPMGGDTLGQYLPDRNPDPAVQADAGARYMRNRYGDPTSARRFWEQNQWYDDGGWLQPGVTQVVNQTGVPEAVFNPWQWQQIRGLVTGISDLHPALRSWVDNGIDELERMANGIEAADRGFREWAAADEERGRMPTAEEVALHYGAEAGATALDSALGLVGLGGIVGSTPNESLTTLINVGAENLNDVYGWNLPGITGEELKPVAVIDSDGRVIGTVLEVEDDDPVLGDRDSTADVVASAADVAEPVATASATASNAASIDDSATASASTPGSREVVIQIEGDAISAATLEKAMGQLSEEVGDLEIRVEKVEGQMVASVVSGVAGIV